MDVDELKLYNLKRLAKKFNCDEPAKLARAIGVSTQHASKLLRGEAGIGNKTIERFVKAFKIDASDRGWRHTKNLMIQKNNSIIIKPL